MKTAQTAKSDDAQLYYQTSDLGIAATLICLGHDLAFLSKSPQQNKATFAFQQAQGLQEIVDGYWNEETLVSPLKLVTALKNLKSRIYNI